MGRFLNADAFTSTGQGLLGNNMFAYCNNNPVNMIDHAGTLPGVIVVGLEYAALITCCVFLIDVVTSPQFQQDLNHVIADINQQIEDAIEELERAISKKMTASIAKAKPRKSNAPHVHHIVAQTDPRATHSRMILEYLFEHGVNDGRNLILVEATVHQRLHTNLYFSLVEYAIVDAFESAKPNRQAQIESVTTALMWLRGFIAALPS